MFDRQKILHWGAISLIVSVFCFHFFTLNKGCGWGDDWAMFVNHAYNIAHGRAYTYPGYIFCPMYPTYSPSAYPPGYPLILAPTVAVWGLELTPLKVTNLLLLAAGLYLTWLLLKPLLRPFSVLAILAIIGFLPYFWLLRDQILSDIPFMTSSLLFLYLFTLWGDRMDGRKSVFLGVLIFFPFAVRSVGIALIAALCAHILLDKSYRKKSNFLILGVGAALVVLQNLLLPMGPGYGSMLTREYEHTVFIPKLLNNIYGSIQFYAGTFEEALLLNGGNDFPLFGKLLAATIPILALAGFLSKRRWTFLETYVCFYLLALFLFPARQGFRYLLGLFPLLLYYGFLFAEQLSLRTIRLTLAGILLPAFLAYTVSWYSHNSKEPIIGNILEENAQNFFRYTRDSLPAGAIFVADKPRLISLLSDHRGTVYPDSNHENDWLDWLNQNNVTYAAKAAWDNDKPDRYWARYIDAHPEEFQKIFEDRGLQVYRYTRQRAAQ